VACNVALRDQARWARGGLVLMSAALDVKRTPLLRAQALAGSLLSALLPDASIVPAAPPERLSRSAESRAAHAADTLVPHHGKLKARLICSAAASRYPDAHVCVSCVMISAG
jgi:hypothetical protein